MTGLEGKYIQNFILDRQKEEWFGNILQSVGPVLPPGLTTNEFATACLTGQEVDQPVHSYTEQCPFLVEQNCSIYAIRPFNCRCFVSREQCGPDHPAVVHDFILSAATAVMQIIEHLNQGGSWGNMLDILRMESSDFINEKQIHQRIQRCKPLPGFLIPPQDLNMVQPLLESIFSAQVDGQSVEVTLNTG